MTYPVSIKKVQLIWLYLNSLYYLIDADEFANQHSNKFNVQFNDSKLQKKAVSFNNNEQNNNNNNNNNQEDSRSILKRQSSKTQASSANNDILVSANKAKKVEGYEILVRKFKTFLYFI